MRNAILLVQSTDGFGSRNLSTAGIYRPDRHVWIDVTQRKLDHRPTLISFDHNAIRVPTAIGIDRPLRPFVRGISARLIIDDVEAAGLVNSAGNNASLVGPLGSADGRINGYNDTV